MNDHDYNLWSKDKREELKIDMWKAMSDRAIQLLRPMANDVLLDIGKNAGTTALAFHKSVSKITAIDITEHGTKKLYEEIQRKHISNIEVITSCKPGLGLPFEDAVFDIVTCRLVLDQVEDTKSFLAEVHRVLKSSGKLGVSVWVLSEGIKDLWTSLTKAVKSDHKNDFTYLEIIELITSTGFEIESMIPFSAPRSLNEKLNRIQDEAAKDHLFNTFLSNKERFAELRFRFIDDPDDLKMLKKDGQPQWFHDFNIIEILAIRR